MIKRPWRGVEPKLEKPRLYVGVDHQYVAHKVPPHSAKAFTKQQLMQYMNEPAEFYAVLKEYFNSIFPLCPNLHLRNATVVISCDSFNISLSWVFFLVSAQKSHRGER